MRLGIRWKWMLAHLFVGSFVFLFMVFYLISRLENYFESRFENHWKRELALAKQYIEAQDFSTLSIAKADRLADQIGEVLAMRVTIVDIDGRVLGDSEVDLKEINEVENHGDRPEIIAARKHGFGKSYRRSTTIDQYLVYLAQPVGNPPEIKGVVRVAVPISEIEKVLSKIHYLIWLAGALGFFLILVIGFVVSRPTTNRLNEMLEAAKRFSVGDFSKTIKPSANDELGDLAKALNQMARDLERNLITITQDRDQLQGILNTMVEGVLVTDVTGKILLINQSFQNIFQLSPSVTKKSYREVIRNAHFLDALERAIIKKEDVVEQIELVSPVGKKLQAHIAIMGTKEDPTGAVAVLHDITQLKHLEEVRRDFVANVSHELQTPLTAIKGYTETLLEDGVPDKKQAKNFLQIILRHTDRMSKLVKDLLILARLELHDSDLDFEELNLGKIITRVVESFSNIKEKNNLELKITIPENLPKVRGIAAELEDVLENLLDNAFKYGARGKMISISAKELDTQVQVDVSDRGIGIPIEHQPRIFERFYRVDKGRSRALGGTGLGLSIVKHAIQRHGGRVWVESEVGKGTTFSFTLPKFK